MQVRFFVREVGQQALRAVHMVAADAQAASSQYLRAFPDSIIVGYPAEVSPDAFHLGRLQSFALNLGFDRVCPESLEAMAFELEDGWNADLLPSYNHVMRGFRALLA